MCNIIFVLILKLKNIYIGIFYLNKKWKNYVNEDDENIGAPKGYVTCKIHMML